MEEISESIKNKQEFLKAALITIILLLILWTVMQYFWNKPSQDKEYTVYLNNGEIITLKNASLSKGYIANDSIIIPFKATKLIKIKQMPKTDK